MHTAPSPARPSRVQTWIVAAILGMGLLLAVLGLALGWGTLCAAGLLVALAGTVGLEFRCWSLQRVAKEREDLLLDLNRNLDEQVGLRTQRLMQTIEDLESFNRMVTHDLSSPLTGLLTGVELLAELTAGHLDEDQKRIMKSIADSANRMQELVQDLRYLAVISGRIPAVETVDLSHHAAVVLQNLQEKEPGRKVIWRIEPGLTVHGDRSLIRIALENLLGNAWKYSLDQNPAKIRVCRGAGEGTTIEIRDNGCGFDLVKADRLFQPFCRMHHDPRYPGSGLGLSIVKRVMVRHGGQVSAASAPGKGSTFRLEFPPGLNPEAGESAGPSEPASAAPGAFRTSG